MTRKIISIVAAICAYMTSPVMAQEADFAESLIAAGGATRTIECDFTLTRTMSFMTADAVSEGRFYYMRDEGISLEFTKPAGDLITMSRERFKIVSAGKTSIVKLASNPMLGQLKNMITACMTGDIALLEEGSELVFADDGTHYVVTMTPKVRRAKNMVKSITLTFEKENMSLTVLRMEEASGDISRYEFGNKKFNVEIDPSHFEIR